MPDFSNKDLDNLFQRGAESYDFEFDPAAWEQMETLLERDRRRRWLLWWLLGLVLLAGLVIGGLSFLNPSAQPSPEPNVENPEPTAADDDIIPGESPFTAPHTTTPPARERPADALDKKVENFAPDSHIPEHARGGEAPPQALAPSAGPPPDVPQAEQLTLATAPGDRQQNALSPLTPLPPQAISEIPALIEFPVPLLATLDPEHLELQSFETLEAPTGVSIHPRSRTNAFYIGLNVSRETASVGFNHFSPFRFKAGVNFDYRFRRRFSAGAGIYYSRKDYSAGPGGYDPKEEGFWTDGIAADETVGYCNMLEVPVYAGFYFTHHSSTSFFIEAGLTNFIMLEEHYYFNYNDPKPGLIKYWGSENEYHAWMSILQLSPGYQFRIGGRSGVQLAPYLQIPVSGVGHGNVNLISAGLNLRVLLRPF